MAEIKCPSHEGVCKFCKSKEGIQKNVNGMPEINRLGEPVVDPCCKHCGSNASYQKQFVTRTSIS